jgi:uncharacterized protein (TIGR02246 family)
MGATGGRPRETPMHDDERAIRSLIDTWYAASEAGDVPKVLSLMADDVLFMVPGKEPFGKDVFATISEGMKGVRLQAKGDIQEIMVLGDWAWCRIHLTVTMTPPNGKPTRRSGYTLTILRKKPNGDWVLARDANLLTTES